MAEKKGMISRVDLAKRILGKAKEKQIEMNVTKLLKLVYICDGILLAYGRNIVRENARAWTYGPVYPKVHKWFTKKYDGNLDIGSDAQRVIAANGVDNIIEAALEKFGDWTAGELSAWTHKQNSPWALAMKNSGGAMNCVISKDNMQMYFAGLLRV